MSELGIILQARTGSTRMPEKVILPFYQEKSILDLLLEKAKKLNVPVVLATTVNPSDDRICLLAEKHQVQVFRGSENDVLERFIQAAQQFGFSKIIRVCADNPFLDLTGMQQLINEFRKSDADYLGFHLDGNKPSILTHFGFWTEAVRLNALEKTQIQTTEKLYHEHVTNFIYGNPSLFKVQFMPADPLVFSRSDIRMTLDTPEDFEIQKEIFAAISKENPNFAIPEIVNWLDRHPEILDQMKREILKNQK
ncbi:MAG TPA: glycosyltransferase family protein [Prolixibacteraceae bacterium]|nr:glycosyltransferase family protein [Prolixibacteraceae bacterium]